MPSLNGKLLARDDLIWKRNKRQKWKWNRHKTVENPITKAKHDNTTFYETMFLKLSIKLNCYIPISTHIPFLFEQKINTIFFFVFFLPEPNQV